MPKRKRIIRPEGHCRECGSDTNVCPQCERCVKCGHSKHCVFHPRYAPERKRRSEGGAQ